MSATNIILLPTKWKSVEKTIGTSVEKVDKPSGIKRTVTVMIQAAKANTGCISFGSDSTLTTLVGAAGQLTAGMSAVIPIDLENEGSLLYVIADTAAQKYWLSVYTGGDLPC
jgi:hypothetical protein